MTSSPSGAKPGSSEATPKVGEAFGIWRWYSREITADLLRFYNEDIRDWYRGDMESSRLLLLLEGLPQDSTFQTWAVRGGDWSVDQYVRARIANEIALSRADGKGYMPTLLKSPFEVANEHAADIHREKRHQATLRELIGEEESHGDHS